MNEGTSILANLLRLVETKLQLNFLVIGFQSVTVRSGFGTLYMQGM